MIKCPSVFYTGSRTPVTLGIDKTFNLTNHEDFHKAKAEIQMKPGDGILETLHTITESYKNGDWSPDDVLPNMY